eukprot:3334316-Amphidinium_carterae.1
MQYMYVVVELYGARLKCMGSLTSPEYHDAVDILKQLVHSRSALLRLHAHIVKRAWREQEARQCSSVSLDVYIYDAHTVAQLWCLRGYCELRGAVRRCHQHRQQARC